MAEIAQNIKKCEHIAQILKALGHPVRLRIVAVLDEAPTHVGGLSERLAAPQAVVSQQLGILRMRGLVQRRREGGRAVYRLAEPRLKELLRCMEGCEIR